MIPDPLLTGQAERRLQRQGFDVTGKVIVVWDRRLKTTAGSANYRRLRIRLHPGLRAFPGETVRTFKHELAHLLADLRAKRDGKTIQHHGREWKQACADLGIPGESRCHKLALRRVRCH